MGEKKTENRKLEVIIAIILVIIIGIAAWIFLDMDDSDKSVEQQSATEAVNMIDVKTPYGTLKYPEEYEAYLEIEEVSSEEQYSKTFYTTVFGEKESIFSVYFNVPDKGTVMGYVDSNDGKIPVSIEVTQKDLGDEVNAETADTYYGMVEGVNDVLISLKNFNGYTDN